MNDSRSRLFGTTATLVVALGLVACSSEPQSTPEESSETSQAEPAWEHAGARLVLTFDTETNAFAGTVENTTEATICSVRVEVHLSTGTELGPTPRKDLTAGESAEVALLTGGEAFDTWTAHPEVLACPGA